MQDTTHTRQSETKGKTQQPNTTFSYRHIFLQQPSSCPEVLPTFKEVQSGTCSLALRSPKKEPEVFDLQDVLLGHPCRGTF